MTRSTGSSSSCCGRNFPSPRLPEEAFECKRPGGIAMRTTKQGIISGLPVVAGFAVVCLLFAGTGGKAQTASETSPQTQEHERLVYAVKGPELFRAYCASCHAEDAKGGG